MSRLVGEESDSSDSCFCSYEGYPLLDESGHIGAPVFLSIIGEVTS